MNSSRAARVMLLLGVVLVGLGLLRAFLVLTGWRSDDPVVLFTVGNVLVGTYFIGLGWRDRTGARRS